ncbi:hypothetical protein EYY60_04605 [Flavobacterium zhairuonense]|uniref:DUF6934 family protein n=1 Tax=Flavobacterium zhairuonense TaxID=2493631 RepID=UPI00104FACAF|nr:hypothetical protein [Flavobacterium zhairuonense]KAF2514032.1 hypothetical protein EYY60_04605 [Flavobacterium zhairuonense]
MIKINLENTFEAIYVSSTFDQYIFESQLKNNKIIQLKVKFTNIADSLLPNVYNLAFGPFDATGKIDDSINLKHKDSNKVFSTIILFSITFLKNNPHTSIGIDGSDDLRANLYHRMFRYNYKDLKDFLVIIGVDWYVRLLRNGTIELDNNGAAFFKPKPESFDFQRKTNDLYRYYMFNLNQ